jgi:hypothetical protein
MCAESRVFTDFAAESRKFAQKKSQEDDLFAEKFRLTIFYAEIRKFARNPGQN